MMRYLFLCSLATVLVAAFSSNPASAQTLYGTNPSGGGAIQSLYGQNPSGSAVSPYLNLMRPGTLSGINYYDLVRPQLQFQNAISSLQSNQAALIQGAAASGVIADSFVPTGHPVLFGNYARYFPSDMSAGGGSGMGGGMLPGQRNLQNQMMMYSPLRGLGGMGTGTGIGGMSSGGMNPGVGGTNPGAPR